MQEAPFARPRRKSTFSNQVRITDAFAAHLITHGVLPTFSSAFPTTSSTA